MTSHLQRWYWVAGAIPVVIALYYTVSVVIAYRRLPIEVPVHFDFEGVPNGFMNKTFWLVLSPVLMMSIFALVFYTRPSPFSVTSILYWGTCGLLAGAFFQINRAAVNQESYKFVPLLLWLFLLPMCEFVVTIASKPWWSGPK